MQHENSSRRDAQQLDQYVAWRTAATRVERAFGAWRAARHDERSKAFAAYARALDREGELARACSGALRDAHALGLVQLRPGPH